MAVTTGGLPPDHFSPQKRTVIPADKITPFIEERGALDCKEVSSDISSSSNI